MSHAPSLLLATILFAAPVGDPVQAWTDDMLHLLAKLEEMHPDPYAGVPREEFDAAVDAFLSGLEGRDEEANTVELMRLLAMLSRGGREGHALVWSTDFDRLPIEPYRFADGWFVTRAGDGLKELVGQRLEAIAGVPIEDLVTRVVPLLSHDNEWNVLARLPHALTTPGILRGLGVQIGTSPVSVRVSDGTHSRELALTPERDSFPAPFLPARGALLSTRGRERSWWSEPLPEAHALYVQFNAVRATDDSGASLASFAATLAPTLESQGLTRLVLDLRWNGGGDNSTFGPLIDALRNPRIDRPGRLVVLISRHTFSAAGNFAAALEGATGATFVGEPTGGAPNQYGDARPVALPNHPTLLVRIATRYHCFTKPDDPRLTTEPNVRVPLLSSDYFAGRDAILQRALELER